MAYNKRNLYRKIVEIQDLTLEHTKKGCTQIWVYENVIKPKYFISQGTYYNYLSPNAKGELKKMELNATQQPTLFE